jgi:hypothetical protein
MMKRKPGKLTLQQGIVFSLLCSFMNCIPEHIGFITFLHFTEFDVFTVDFEMKLVRTSKKVVERALRAERIDQTFLVISWPIDWLVSCVHPKWHIHATEASNGSHD